LSRGGSISLINKDMRSIRHMKMVKKGHGLEE
jgi:hypothetical protein